MDLLSETSEDNSVLVNRGKWCPLCLRYTLTSIFIFSLMCFTLLVCRNYVKDILSILEDQHVIVSTLIFIILFTTVSFPFMWGYILLNVAAGYLYSIVCGQLIVMISAISGLLIAHFVIKKCFSNWVYNRIKSKNFTAFTRLVQGPQGFKVVILSRLTPIPFGLQNAIFALTNITWWKYVATSVVGLFPTQLLNTYIGTTLRSMEDVLTDDTHTTTGYIVFTTQLIITFLLTVYVSRRAKRELDKTVEEFGSDVENGTCLSKSPAVDGNYNSKDLSTLKTTMPLGQVSNGFHVSQSQGYCVESENGEKVI
ncbi:transmembrane protein 64-like [Lineus longissimus]|uniref:transmembrane protein 64-like n=1 Tax=Lineus longissimus TaxID=88925 RepID=UPI00315C5217